MTDGRLPGCTRTSAAPETTSTPDRAASSASAWHVLGWDAHSPPETPGKTVELSLLAASAADGSTSSSYPTL